MAAKVRVRGMNSLDSAIDHALQVHVGNHARSAVHRCSRMLEVDCRTLNRRGYGDDTVMIRLRYGHGTVMIRPWYGDDAAIT